MQSDSIPPSCSSCSAPLVPGERQPGELLSCQHCGQVHVVIAPGEIEPQREDARYRRLLLSVVGAVIAVVALMGLFGFLLAKRAGGRTPLAAPLTADMPIAIGDALEMRVGSTSCPLDVLDALGDGRILAQPCGAAAPSPVGREKLWVEAFPAAASARSLLSGDVVLARTHAGWLRGTVIGPGPGAGVGIHPLGTPAEAEHVARSRDLVRVQSVSSPGYVHVPLPVDAPISAGDVFYRRRGPAFAAVRVSDVATPELRLETGSASRGRFVPDGGRIALSRGEVLALAVRVHEPLAPGSRVLVRIAGVWLRRKVVSDDGASLRVTPEAGGAEELRPKLDLILLGA